MTINPETILSVEVVSPPTIVNGAAESIGTIQSGEFVSVDFIIANISSSSFAQQIESDIQDTFLSIGDFAENVTFYPVSSSPFVAPIIFDSSYITIDPNTGAGVMSEQPKGIAQTSKISRIGSDTRCVIRGVSYIVKRVEPDGTGISEVFFHKEKTV